MENIWTAPVDSPPAIIGPLQCGKRKRVFTVGGPKINFFWSIPAETSTTENHKMIIQITRYSLSK
jgi:hypothetical protein